MKVLVIGSGGREHAIAWKLTQSKSLEKIYCAPGNPGMRQIAECINVKADDIEGLKDLALAKKIDLTIVGPEVPLAMGLTDRFEEAGMKAFGPSKKAAEIEGSKAFAKELMRKYGIPTADYKTFVDITEAKRFAEKQKLPLVVKADGLAAGKGVILCETIDEALGAIELIMKDKAFGDAGNTVIIEEFLAGQEVSFIVITDGKTVLPLATSQDHKQVYDNDKGPNTGGMGAYSPAPLVTPKLQKRIMDEIMLPAIDAMNTEGRPYKGVLYAGLMINERGPKVLEFNCRLGDPETQPILMRFKDDLLDVILAATEGRLSSIGEIKWDKRTSVCVVMASEGYPGVYKKGVDIFGLENVSRMEDVFVFHAGTAMKEDSFITAGGRVLGVTGLGADVKDAINKTYNAVEMISWTGAHYRRDIGRKAMDDYCDAL